MIFTARSVPMGGYPQQLFDVTSEWVEQSKNVTNTYPSLDRNVWSSKPDVENKWRRQNRKCLKFKLYAWNKARTRSKKARSGVLYNWLSRREDEHQINFVFEELNCSRLDFIQLAISEMHTMSASCSRALRMVEPSFFISGLAAAILDFWLPLTSYSVFIAIFEFLILENMGASVGL